MGTMILWPTTQKYIGKMANLDTQVSVPRPTVGILLFTCSSVRTKKRSTLRIK